MTLNQRQGLVVRGHTRQEIALRAHVSLPPASETIAKLSDRAPTTPEGVEAVLIDIGAGGLGFESTVFFPRDCRVCISITDPDGNGEITNVRGVVRRAQMIDRAPTYSTGVQFTDLSDRSKAAIAQLTGGEAA